VLADEMTEMVSVESQRLGAWVVLKEGTGAQLLCPATGSVLSREDAICKNYLKRLCENLLYMVRMLSVSDCAITPPSGILTENSQLHH